MDDQNEAIEKFAQHLVTIVYQSQGTHRQFNGTQPHPHTSD